MTSWTTAAPEAAEPAPPSRPPGRRRVGALGLLGVALVAALALTVTGSREPSSALPPPALDGADGYRFIHVDEGTALPSRFDPCAPVSYVINPAGAPARGVEDVEEAFRRAELATGIRFVYEGEVDEVPSRDRPPHQPERYGDRWAPILVGWTAMDAGEGERIHGTVVGWAAHSPLLSAGRQDVVTTGTIALDADARSVNAGFGAGRRWGNVILHEVGHLLGLDHSEGRGEVMAETVDRGAGRWGAGDLLGLAYLGSEAGCLRVPAPGQVDLRP